MLRQLWRGSIGDCHLAWPILPTFPPTHPKIKLTWKLVVSIFPPSFKKTTHSVHPDLDTSSFQNQMAATIFGKHESKQQIKALCIAAVTQWKLLAIVSEIVVAICSHNLCLHTGSVLSKKNVPYSPSFPPNQNSVFQLFDDLPTFSCIKVSQPICHILLVFCTVLGFWKIQRNRIHFPGLRGFTILYATRTWYIQLGIKRGFKGRVIWVKPWGQRREDLVKRAFQTKGLY